MLQSIRCNDSCVSFLFVDINNSIEVLSILTGLPDIIIFILLLTDATRGFPRSAQRVVHLDGSITKGGHPALIQALKHQGQRMSCVPDLALVHIVPARKIEIEKMDKQNDKMSAEKILLLADKGCCC